MGHCTTASRPRLAAAALAVLLATGAAQHVRAADLGGDCCADLEERIAELEATTARKGNRKVSLTVAGQVNHAVLFWDDGFERNTYVVGNKNDQSNFSFTGEAEIRKGLRAGYAVTVRIRDSLSDEVDQTTDDGALAFVLWESFWFLESERYGKLSLGQVSRVSDTAPENDLSESGLPGYAGVQDMGGGFFLRLSNGALSAITLGDVYNHFNGDTANVVRYDTPVIAGFILSASYGEDDIWDVGLKYEGGFNSVKLAASIAYTHSTDEGGLDGGGDVAHETLVGSFAILHEPSGLNALVAAGNRSFDDPVLDADLVQRTPKDASFIYTKLGWLAKLTSLGPTAFYGEYGRFNDFISTSDTFLPADIGAGGVRITGNTAQVWGFGVVQHIEAAEMQIYAGYRHHDFDFDVVDGGGNAVPVPGIESFQSIVVGSKISF
ncbi:MAG: porin [Hyphomicrobiaceae bacterium]